MLTADGPALGRSRIFFCASRNSTRSASVRPGRFPPSTSAFFIQPVKTALRDPEVPRDLIQRSLALTGNCHDIVAELLEVGLWHGRHPSSEDESSQVRCQPKSGQTPAWPFVAGSGGFIGFGALYTAQLAV